ncbi:hypothetical protein [Comamonas antarctica]|uniref:Uncharacterized protein n=1 Tax=Comamonas antarctica TaxID=2743470 RepID=A0A6N1X0Z1_9BURK|nr:hypothetical protein [Comamonas antarctica]QKV52638.1 hypothetical protein HUK68_06820 [Comamonas antarctica]
MTLLIVVLAILAALVLLGFALAPLMAASGLWAAATAKGNAAKAAEIQRLLDVPDR